MSTRRITHLRYISSPLRGSGGPEKVRHSLITCASRCMASLNSARPFRHTCCSAIAMRPHFARKKRREKRREETINKGIRTVKKFKTLTNRCGGRKSFKGAAGAATRKITILQKKTLLQASIRRVFRRADIIYKNWNTTAA